MDVEWEPLELATTDTPRLKPHPVEKFDPLTWELGTLLLMDEDIRQALEAAATNAVFTTAEAEAHGIPRMELISLARKRYITHVERGIWTTRETADAEGRHLVRTIGLLRRLRHRTGAHAHSALLLHGLPLVFAKWGRVVMARSEGEATRSRASYAIWGHSGPLIETCRHPWLTTPEPTVTVETAILGAGIVCSPRTALVAADAALREGLVSPETLELALGSAPIGTHHIARVRAALALADGRRESPGETLTALVCARFGFDLLPQVQIGPWRVDFLIAGSRVILEFDGAGKYEDRSSLLSEKRREDDLRARGYVVVRLMWEDLRHPQLVRAKILQALSMAA